jgi:hypothetical protein
MPGTIFMFDIKEKVNTSGHILNNNLSYLTYFQILIMIFLYQTL